MKLPAVYGKYRLMERIASGGMAEVFKAVAMGEAGFEKPVAVKLLHRHFSEDEDLVAMLQDEARLCSLLHHGNICQVLDLGLLQDTYYIAMEYVNGRDLFNVLRKASQTSRALPLPAALFIASEMLAGLDYAHRKRDNDGRLLHIIHRDISPQNVLVTWDGEVKIIDFGIAKARTSTHKTQAGIIKGKFRYMSPEQARGEPIDHRADIFAAGVVLYEMILGRPHAAGATDREILIKIQSGQFERLGQQMSGLPADLEEMVHRALATQPESRWSSARAFRKALTTFMRMNRLAYTKDELSEYIRYLFKEDTGQDTSVEAVGVLSDRDMLPGEGLPESARDPFLPSAPVPDLSFSGPSPLPPPNATVSLQSQRMESPAAPAAPPAPQRSRKASRDARTVAMDTPGPGARGAVGTDPRSGDTAHVSPSPPRRGPSSVVVAFRWLMLLGLLGLMGLGGYYVYILFVKKPGLARRLRLGKAKPGMRRVPRFVKASFEIDSRPKGARIFLNGEDTNQPTPGVFKDITAPRRVLIELRHPRFKTPWKRIIPLHEGDVVKLTADLRHPPPPEGTPRPAGAVRLPPSHGSLHRGGRPGRGRAPPAARGGGNEAPPSADEARLHVTTDAPGAEVLINGAVRGTTPLRKRVRPATFSVQVKRGARRSDVRVVTLAPGQIKRLHFALGQ